MDESSVDYLYSDPYDAPVPIGLNPSFLDILQEEIPKIKATRSKIVKQLRTKDRKMDTTKKAFDLGASRATREFMKSAGILDAYISTQAKDPRKALALSSIGAVQLGLLAKAGLLGRFAVEGSDILTPGVSHALGTLSGIGALGTAAYLGSTAPGLLSPTTVEQRLASEVAAKLQNPETMGSTLKNLGVGGLAALAVPAAIYQLGKLKGESDASLF